jgi:hypothetical protein
MNSHTKKILLLAGLVLGLALALTACGSQATPTPCPDCPDCPTCPEAPACPEAAPCPTPEPTMAAPNVAEWKASGHSNAEAAAFTHWNEDDPAEVPVGCAKCHSDGGFKDFVGADGSEANKVDAAAAIGTVINCTTCHNEATASLSTVMFPSGVELTGLGSEAICMTCHQGVTSVVQVNDTLAAAGLTDDDTVVSPDAKLSFINVHYNAAAIAFNGTTVKGGYEYADKAYDVKFQHPVAETCTDCHNAHSGEVKVELCAECHQGVAAVEDLKNIRMVSSMMDYDGDGDTTEGIATEVEGLQAMLYTAIQAYAKEVAGTAIVYDAATYPYFFIDTNADGVTDADEAAFANSYKAWTGRLMKAAYNMQVSVKDPGAFAHGGKYIIELLYDSTADLNTKLATPVDLSKAHRMDAGHFASSEMAFRDWDADGEVPAGCAKCHSPEGLPQFIKEGVNVSSEIGSSLACHTCHNDFATYGRFEVAEVTFPSGAKAGFENSPDSNLCMLCHQGRQSTASVDKYFGDADADTAVEKFSFRNVHYFAAGATLFGTEVKGMYEYAGKTYNGRFVHVENMNTCTSCHDAHGLAPKVEACAGCHGTEDVEAIRMPTSDKDYDGDGDTTEGIAGEIATMQEKLYAAIQLYATEVTKAPVIYDINTYPYFIGDANANGTVDADEKAYTAWTPRLMKAGYNLQYSYKDPGAFVHNGKYVLQALYDSLEDLGTKVAVDMTGMVRPEVPQQ